MSNEREASFSKLYDDTSHLSGDIATSWSALVGLENFNKCTAAEIAGWHRFKGHIEITYNNAASSRKSIRQGEGVSVFLGCTLFVCQIIGNSTTVNYTSPREQSEMQNEIWWLVVGSFG